MFASASCSCGHKLDPPQLGSPDAEELPLTIIWNLLGNALKFTPRGGQVTARLQQDTDNVLLEVTDTGCGIKPDHLKSIFEIFQQTPNVPYRARTGGLGIGLSLVRQLAELHGGKADAFSDGIGKGARFVVRLPSDASSATRRAGERPAELSIFENARMLLVEDSTESLTAMADLLSLFGAKISTAANGADGLQAASDADFRVIVTDLGLPDMDGYQLMRQLRKLKRCETTPIIAVTGRPVAQEEGPAREAGCNACLTKPFNLQALADAMHRFDRGGQKH